MNVMHLLDIKKQDFSEYKVHIASGTKEDNPLHHFYRGDFKHWQEQQTRKNFERKKILSLVHIGSDEWLFVGIHDSHGVKAKNTITRFQYDTTLSNQAETFIGRLILRFKRARASYLRLENCIKDFSLIEIKKAPMSIERFRSFESTLIDYETLQTIYKKQEISWKTAMKSRKGVYLITDRATGKLYVGSAYGEEALWQRWSEYAKTGYGGNVELVALLKNEGNAYMKNMQFSVLETYGLHVDDQHILDRESHWKNVLLSRDFGYNAN